MPKDNYLTIAAIAILAYLLADVAHHAFGHGAACILLGGHINSLSSIFVNCSLTGSVIDLAGPLANFILGVLGFALIPLMGRTSSSNRLFLTLVAAFNLFWLWLQLAANAATMTDDWAWPMKQLRINGIGQYAMVAAGIAGYLFTIRMVAKQLASFSIPVARVRIIVMVALISAGIIATVTAAFDPHATEAILRHALPQSLLSSIGLLFVPSRASRCSSSDDVANPVPFSLFWVITAALSALASVVLLGAGIAFKA